MQNNIIKPIIEQTLKPLQGSTAPIKEANVETVVQNFREQENHCCFSKILQDIKTLSVKDGDEGVSSIIKENVKKTKKRETEIEKGKLGVNVPPILDGVNVVGKRVFNTRALEEPADLLRKELEELSKQNSKNLRKPRRRKDAENLAREIALIKKAVKSELKRRRKLRGMLETPEEFDTQMWDYLAPSLKVKMEEEQLQRIEEVSSKLQSTVEIASNALKDSSNLQQAAQTLAGFAGSSFAGGAIKTFYEEIASVFEGMIAKYGNIVLSIAVCGAVLSAYKAGITKRKIAMMIMPLVGFLLWSKWKDVGSSLLDFLTEYIAEDGAGGGSRSKEVFEAQMMDITVVTDLVIALMTLISFPGLKSKSDMAGIAKLVGSIGRDYHGIENMMGVLTRLIQACLDTGARKLGLPSFSLLSTMVPQVDAWCKETRSFLTKFAENSGAHDQELFNRVSTLERTCLPSQVHLKLGCHQRLLG